MNRPITAIILVVSILVVLGILAYFSLNCFLVYSGPPKPTVYNFSEEYWNGTFAFGFSVGESAESAPNGFLVVMDNQGNYVSFENSSRYNFDYIYQLGKKEIFVYLRPSNRSERTLIPEAIIWNWNTGEIRKILEGIDIRGHHELLIEEGYLVTLRRAEGNVNGLDTIVEIDAETGNVTWSWSSETLFQERPCSLCPDDDWTHANDVTVSLDGRYYFINFRNTDSFAKIDRSTKELVWIAGRNGNFTLLENGIEKESLWYHSHVIKEIEPNVFLMFDNDFHNRTHLDAYPEGEDPYINYGGRSRLIEITLDETTMTGEITWSFEPPTEYFSSVFGDVDLLPNGNILGVFGTPAHNWTANHVAIEEPFGAAILEVNRKAELVREYLFPFGVAIYRVQELSEDPTDYVGSWLRELK
jgi:hypothetical protein